MSDLVCAPWQSEGLTITCDASRVVTIRGEIAMRDPLAELQPYLRTIHAAARGGGDLIVDVTGLAFMNSSAIRLFLDWATWIRAEPDGQRYHLTFRTSTRYVWQRAAFPAICSLVGDIVSTVAA